MNEINLLSEALKSSHCIISIMGDHAGEDTEKIFYRKIEDIHRTNCTYWLIKSPKAKPPLVQQLCTGGPAYVLFVAPAVKGGARSTEIGNIAKEYSIDGLTWDTLPVGLGPVTGKLDSQAYALVFDALETIADGQTVNLWDYADFETPERPVRTILGCSTICAIMQDTSDYPDRLKSNVRRILAIARLTKPYCVFVR